MQIDSLVIAGFRNFNSVEISLASGANLLFGSNGSGKSNLLEAIYYLCTAKSFRGATDDVIKNRDSEFFRIAGEGYLEDRAVKIELAYKPREKKHLKINDVPQPKLAALYEYLKVVFFGPDDVELILGSPAVRRRFLDISIAQLEPGYISLLWEYKKILAQRNALLKELGNAYDSLGVIDDCSSLLVWDEKLIELGLDINRSRNKFIQTVSNLAKGYHEKLSGSNDELRIAYKASPTLDNYTPDAYRNKLDSKRTRELFMGQSMYGPHRDDLQFLLSNYDCKGFASRGQVKTAVLSAKLAVFEYTKQLCGEAPILLLDEVYSDLDRKRLDYLMSLFPSLSQVIVTTSKLGEVKELDIFGNIMRVDGGSIEKYMPQL